METYKVKVVCSNCHKDEEVEIPKGTTVDGWLGQEKNNVCPSCGCERRMLDAVWRDYP